MRIVLLLTCLTLTACAAFPQKDLGKIQPLAARFSEAMRWQDYTGAVGFLAAEHRAAFLEQFLDSPDLHVVDSQVLGLIYDDQQQQVTATYALDYYLLPSTRIQRWQWRQQWQRQISPSGRKSSWLITNPAPSLNAP